MHLSSSHRLLWSYALLNVWDFGVFPEWRDHSCNSVAPGRHLTCRSNISEDTISCFILRWFNFWSDLPLVLVSLHITSTGSSFRYLFRISEWTKYYAHTSIHFYVCFVLICGPPNQCTNLAPEYCHGKTLLKICFYFGSKYCLDLPLALMVAFYNLETVSQCVMNQGSYQCLSLCSRYADSRPRELIEMHQNKSNVKTEHENAYCVNCPNNNIPMWLL